MHHEYGHYPPLSFVLTTAVAELLKLGMKVLVVPQLDVTVVRKVGNQPRFDYGIFIVVGIDRRHLMIIEYKPQADADVGSVNCANMAELFLYGYYILKKKKSTSLCSALPDELFCLALLLCFGIITIHNKSIYECGLEFENNK